MRSRKTAITFPAARPDGLLVEQVGKETVVYDTEAKEAHCLKGLASVVFSHADGKTSAEDLAAIAEKELGEPITFAHVQDAITQLEAVALLDTPLLVRDGLSRRQLVQKAGYIGAAATVASPLITSVLTPATALATDSSIPSGCSGCGKNSDCASNHCCQDVAGKHSNQGCCVGKDNSCHFCGCDAQGNCNCTVTPSDIGAPQCPCICGTPGCSPPCCPPNQLCCTNQLPTGCV